MRSFYLQLWFFWMLRLIATTLLVAVVIAAGITAVIYIRQGSLALEKSVVDALVAIWQFWFMIALNFSLLFALFRGVKYLFNRCYGGYSWRLKSCSHGAEGAAYIDPIGYGDLIKVWRRWLLYIVWMSASFMIVTMALHALIYGQAPLFAWFSIYWLYLFIVLGAYPALFLLSLKCKAIKVKRC